MTTSTNHSALLVMDVQPGILDRVDNPDQFLANVTAAVDAAHARHIPVIYVVVGFRAGMPEVSAHNKSFSGLRSAAAPGFIDPKPAIAPTADDIVVTKRRVSAFTGSDLEVVLRGREIRHLVLTGIATSGVVLSTLREAADKDFELTVLSDLCADMDAEVHRVLLEKVFPRQAAVVTSKEWLVREL